MHPHNTLLLPTAHGAHAGLMTRTLVDTQPPTHSSGCNTQSPTLGPGLTKATHTPNTGLPFAHAPVDTPPDHEHCHT